MNTKLHCKTWEMRHTRIGRESVESTEQNKNRVKRLSIVNVIIIFGIYKRFKLHKSSNGVGTYDCHKEYNLHEQ